MIQRLAIAFVGGLVCLACGGENPMGPSQTNLPPAAPMAPVAPVLKPTPAAAAVVSGPVIYDARDRAKLPPGVEREPKLAPELEKLVFSALSATYKAKPEDCQGTDDVLFHARNAATGAFTAAATKQTAYLVASGPCSAAADTFEVTHIVVVEANKVVAQATGKARYTTGETPAPFLGTDIRGVLDVDGDGIAEILVASQDGLPPVVDEADRFFSLAGGAIKRVWSFASVYKDGCAAGSSTKVVAQVLHYTPGIKDPTTRYSAENFEAVCPAPGVVLKLTDFLKPGAPAAAPAAVPAAPGAAPSTAPTLPTALPTALAGAPSPLAASPAAAATPSTPDASPTPMPTATTAASPQPSP